MAEPVKIDIPHKLGQAAARNRLEAGFDRLTSFVPGGRVTEHVWEDNRLRFTVEALGQRVSARLDVLDQAVHAEIDLPPTLALFASRIKGALGEAGTRLLT
ncbi:hypothetical protein EOD43_18425 [Sphingomonas crocodyli]|uniref:Polyhydroxyalkanoic acid system protein n=2 Tax=Sphingomonas crocodyli TaxID=1979270 RepID=A0A437LYM9_9SPHN|nr:hypothetical protein EOD43_18425 [Sphingomonas crocodyli]